MIKGDNARSLDYSPCGYVVHKWAAKLKYVWHTYMGCLGGRGWLRLPLLGKHCMRRNSLGSGFWAQVALS